MLNAWFASSWNNILNVVIFQSFRFRAKWWDPSAFYNDWPHLLSAWVSSLLILRKHVNRLLFGHCLFSSHNNPSCFFPFILIYCKFVDKNGTFVFAFDLINTVCLLSLQTQTLRNLRILFLNFIFKVLLEILNITLPQHPMIHIAFTLLICNVSHTNWLFSDFQVVIEPLLKWFIQILNSHTEYRVFSILKILLVSILKMFFIDVLIYIAVLLQ